MVKLVVLVVAVIGAIGWGSSAQLGAQHGTPTVSDTEAVALL